MSAPTAVESILTARARKRVSRCALPISSRESPATVSAATAQQRLVAPAGAILEHRQAHGGRHRDRRAAVPPRRAATLLRLPVPLRLDRRQRRLVPRRRHRSAPRPLAARAASPAPPRPYRLSTWPP